MPTSVDAERCAEAERRGQVSLCEQARVARWVLAWGEALVAGDAIRAAVFEAKVKQTAVGFAERRRAEITRQGAAP